MTTLRQIVNEIKNQEFPDIPPISDNFTVLDLAKDTVKEEMKKTNAFDFFMALTMLGIGSLIGEIKSSVESFPDLSDIINDQPEFVSEKRLEQFEEINRRIRDTIRNLENNIKRMESSDYTELLNEELSKLSGGHEIDSYDFFNIPGARGRRVINTVQQLGERYYNLIKDEQVFSGSENQEDIGRFSGGFAGFDRAVLSDDGTLTLFGQDDGLNVTTQVKLFKESTPIFKANVKGVLEELKTDAESAFNNLKDDFGFEIWACLLLEAVDALIRLWEKIKSKLIEAISVFRIQKNIINGLPFAEFPSFKVDGDSLRTIMGAIKSPSDTLINILGIKNSFLDTGALLSGNTSICSVNHAQYCNISSTLSRMTKNYFADLDRLGMKLNGFDTPSWNVDGFLAAVNTPFDFLESQIEKADLLVESIEKDFCGLISRRMKGKPKSLSGLEGILTGMIPFLTSLSSFFNPSFWDLPQTQKLEDTVKRLNKFGYTAAAAALRSGQIGKFMSITEDTSTLYGQAAERIVVESTPEKMVAARKLQERLRAIHELDVFEGRVSSLIFTRFYMDKTFKRDQKEVILESVEEWISE